MGSFRHRLALGARSILGHPAFLPSAALFGVLFRLLLLWTTRHNTVFPDELAYESIGTSLWQNHTFANHGILTAFRTPAEPFLIAGLYSLFGRHAIIVKLVEVLLLTAIPFLCAAIGRRLGLSGSLANLGALLATLHPALAYASTTLYPTIITTVLLTAGILFCVVAESDGNLGTALWGGLSLGFAGLSTTVFVPLPLIVGLHCAWKRQFRVAAVIAVVGLVPALVWTARNHATLGKAVLATNGNYNLYLGANDQATPESGNLVPIYKETNRELDDDLIWKAQATAWIRLHPARYMWLSFRRALLVLDSVGNPKTHGMHSGFIGHLIGWLMLPVVLLGLSGLILRRGEPIAFFTITALVLVAGSSALTIVKPRFRFPCDPILAVFAVIPLAGLARHIFDSNAQASVLASPGS